MGHLQPRKPVILGSSSKWRAEILRAADIPFTVRSPDIDEKSIRNDNPYFLTLAIATAKAKAIMEALRNDGVGEALVITADQVTVFRGTIREKPSDRAQAREWLAQYRQNCVHVVSTVVVTDTASRESVNGHDTVTVEFGPFPDQVIDCLIGKGDVLQSCGAFVHEDPAIVPFVRCHRDEAVSGFEALRDRKASRDVLSSVSGLPLSITLRLLRQLGWKR